MDEENGKRQELEERKRIRKESARESEERKSVKYWVKRKERERKGRLK